MAETQEQKPPIDYKSVRVGPFPDKFFDGMPTDAGKSWVLDRAGTPYADPADATAPHPLRTSLKHTHAGDEATNIRRVCSPFPPKDYDKPLSTAGDYLKAIDACSAVPAKAEGDAAKAEPDKAGEAPKQAEAPSAPTEEARPEEAKTE